MERKRNKIKTKAHEIEKQKEGGRGGSHCSTIYMFVQKGHLWTTKETPQTTWMKINRSTDPLE